MIAPSPSETKSLAHRLWRVISPEAGATTGVDVPSFWRLSVGCASLQLIVLVLHTASGDMPTGNYSELAHLVNLSWLTGAIHESNWAWVERAVVWDYYPPILYLPLALVGQVVTLTRGVAVCANAVWLVLLYESVGRIALRCHGRRAGQLAIGICALMPVLCESLVHFQPTIPHTALIAWAVLLLTRPGIWSRLAHGLSVGLVISAAMLTDRLVTPVFLIGPVVVSIWRSRGERPRLAPLGIAALVFVSLCSPQALSVIGTNWDFLAEQAVEGEISMDTGLSTGQTAEVALLGVAYYPLSLLDTQLGPLLSVLLLVGGLAWIRAFRTAKPKQRRAQLAVAAWFMTALVVFTFIEKKQTYYLIPALPALAILGAVGLARVVRPVHAVGIVVVILALGNAHLTYRFVPFGNPRGIVGDTAVLAAQAVAGPVLPERWVVPRYQWREAPMRSGIDWREVAHQVRIALGDTAPHTGNVGLFCDWRDGGDVAFATTLAFRLRIHRVHSLGPSASGFVAQSDPRGVFVYLTGAPDRTWPTEDSYRATVASFPWYLEEIESFLEFQRRHARAELKHRGRGRAQRASDGTGLVSVQWFVYVLD